MKDLIEYGKTRLEKAAEGIDFSHRVVAGNVSTLEREFAPERLRGYRVENQ